ncbi:MAG: hexose kinase [Anaerolineae bacterium]|nr:hexose kinase [Anaerolineae bacterium]
MIVTVTPNTTFDRTVVVPEFQMGTTMRATATAASMGGKPTDASYVLGELGIPSLALGFAAGLTGQQVAEMLHARGVTTDFVPVGGETRLSLIIVSEAHHDHATITTATLAVEPAHVETLRQQFIAVLDEASVIVIGGTQPAGAGPPLYEELITLAREHGVPVILDASGEALLDGLAGRPDYVKPNNIELGWLLEREIETLADAYEGGRELQARYGAWPVVTLGGTGGLAVLPDRAYYVPPLPVEVVSAAGAGDAVLAGLAWAIGRGEALEDGLRLGFAAAAAVCLLPGTADCRKEDVERLLPQVELIPYP